MGAEGSIVVLSLVLRLLSVRANEHFIENSRDYRDFVGWAFTRYFDRYLVRRFCERRRRFTWRRVSRYPLYIWQLDHLRSHFNFFRGFFSLTKAEGANPDFDLKVRIRACLIGVPYLHER